MNTSIIAVGTELLFGQTVNTNAAYLSENLNHLGFNVMYHFVAVSYTHLTLPTILLV